ncbi:MAG: hypothetical protein ABIV51_00715, partial [Saprospiraceae bacterium]
MNLLNKIGGIFGLIFGGIICLPAQNLLSSLVQLEVPATKTFIPISPAEIWLPSLQLMFAHSGNSVPQNWYSVDTVGIHLICADSILLQDLFLTLQYRKLPSQITSQIVSIVGQEDLPEPQREYLLKPALPQTYLPAREEKSLIYSGNFVRGIGLGNRQSLGFESAFNLQMSGQLAPDLNILASISDQSVPLQPDGSTQSLRDLDQIFIQLQKDSTVLTMGDFDQSSPTGYFMRYQKRSLGIQLEYQEKLDPSKSLAGKVGFAMNRGQFNRYTIPNKEGNQGPYPLPGAKGEQLVVLIANTEKIYLDGILLLRGYDQDYIIDYNLGVITFTNRRMITQDSRIIAEYEYTDLAYPRTLFTAENQIKINRWTIQSNFYREQDSKKSGFGQKLSDEDREILANAGDNIVGQFGSGIDLQADYQEDQIRYKLIDTLVQGTMYHEVLVRSSESEIARYTAKFTNVGAGNGNYLRSNPESNGAVYQWIAPDPLSGKSNGQFEPIVSLVAPQAQQMVTFGGKYEGKKGQIIETEMAISSFDKNRFSKIGDQDNTGLAVLTKFLQPIKYNSQSKTKTAINGQYEYRNSFFAEINPYRAAEFARDWNLRSVQQQEEHIATIGFQMAQSERKKISYQAQTLLRPGDYQCLKHNLSADFLQNGWEFHTRSSYLNARDSSMATSFVRPNISLAKTFSKLKKIKIGLDVEMENQSSKDLQNNELQIGSFQNQSYRASAGLPLKKGNLLQMSISQRLNKLPEKGHLTDATKSLDFGLNGSLSPSRYTTLSWNATFRKLTLINENLQGIRNTNSILGRLQYDLKRWHEAVISSTIYEMNSG